MAKLLLGSVSEVNAAALPEDVHATQRMAVSYNVRIEYRLHTYSKHQSRLIRFKGRYLSMMDEHGNQVVHLQVPMKDKRFKLKAVPSR